MTNPSGLRTTTRDGVLLNRHDKRNALDEALQNELMRVFTDAARNPEVRGIVLTGGDHGEGVRDARERRAPSFARR